MLEFYGKYTYQQNYDLDKDCILDIFQIKSKNIVKIKSQDMIKQKKNSISFSACEISLMERYSGLTGGFYSYNTKNETPAFTGIFFTAHNLRKVKSGIIIRSRDKYVRKYFKECNDDTLIKSGCEELDKQFLISCKDQNSAKEILTSDFCKKIITLSKVFFSQSDKFILSYKNDRLSILIPHSEKIFEPDFDYPLTNLLSINSLKKQIEVVDEFSDFLCNNLS